MSAISKNVKIYCATYLSVGPRNGFVASVCVLVCVFCQKAPDLFYHAYESVVIARPLPPSLSLSLSVPVSFSFPLHFLSNGPSKLKKMVVAS